MKTKSIQKAEKLRRKWETDGTRILKINQRPSADLCCNKLLPEKERYKNVKKRLKHLAQVLALLHKIYKADTNLYGDKFLAFVGNEVVRKWPWKDFLFISRAAQQKIRQIDPDLKIADLEIRRPKGLSKKITFEHWTPISFFRDVFDLDSNLTEADFYQILLIYYRVVLITIDEDKKLNHKFKSNRSPETYSQLGIEICDKNLWEELK